MACFFSQCVARYSPMNGTGGQQYIAPPISPAIFLGVLIFIANVADAKLVIEVTLSEKFENGKAKVSVPFTDAVPEGKVVKVYFINGDAREDMNATLADGKIVFETNHFSTYAVFFEDAPSSSGSNGGGITSTIRA